MNRVKIIGAGLAGSEAALYLANRGWRVDLYEMRPKKQTEAHESGNFAELVCSNSLKSKLSTTSSGLLKEELNLLNCELLPIANECSVPAGNALAIDRTKFGEVVTELISNHDNINIHREEVSKLDDERTIIATGPLTSQDLTQEILKIIGRKHLFFFDAIAPIVSADSINMDIAFKQSRRNKGDADYINCPFNKEEYYNFVDALNEAEKHEAKEFENDFFKDIKFKFYENCTPIEELARRGKETLRYGVLRAVGLDDPRTGRWPYACLQLRAETKDFQSYNLVGCQTMMRYPEQKRVLRLIPGLENAEFLRFGSIHRNTYLNTPEICNKDFSLLNKSNIYLAGQISGVEGYVESIYSGLLIAKILNGENVEYPETTIVGQLKNYLRTEQKNFQPMNSNFGLLPPVNLPKKDKKKKKELFARRSIEDLTEFLK